MPSPFAIQPMVRTHGDHSFQDLMAEQLHRSPWFVVSLALHGLVVLLLCLIPAEPPRAEAKAVTMALAPAPDVIEPDVPPPEVPKIDPVEPTELVDVVDPVPAPEADTDVAIDSPTSDVVTANDLMLVTGDRAVGLGSSAPPRYRQRGRGGRGGRGGRVDDHVQHALAWLVRHQDETGGWDCDEFMKHDAEGVACDGAGDPLHDVGVTGLALLALLGDGSTLRQGPYREPIRRGVIWLRQQQDDATGCLGTTASQHAIYGHAIATLALCEACGLSNYKTLRPTVQKALDYLQSHRNPYGVWRYQPRSGDQDMSVTGWAALALIAAHEFEFAVDRNALADVDAFVVQKTDTAGRVGYLERGGMSARRSGEHALRFPVDRNECMTSVALLCRALTVPDPRSDARAQAHLAVVMRKLPAWRTDTGGSSLDFYAWYYGSYAVNQMGEPHWTQWSRALTDAVLKKQRGDGNFKGSWDPVDAWGEDGGRVYSTATLALTLQAYYRYARVIGGR
jgi:hypothetical protein